jgi:type IV pilus assembly protein PilV
MNPLTPQMQHCPAAPAPLRRHPRETGATLIEVLVAVLLITVGLLGMAGMAGATFGYNKTAQLRMTGQALANDYAERARMNIAGFDHGKYTITASTTKPSKPTLNAAQTNDTTAADEMATSDMFDFFTNVANALPDGKPQVSIDSTTGTYQRFMNVWLIWSDPADAATDATSNAANCPAGTTGSCMYFRIAL